MKPYRQGHYLTRNWTKSHCQLLTEDNFDELVLGHNVRKISMVLWMEDRGFVTSAQVRKRYNCSCLCHKAKQKAELQLYW